MTAARQPVIFRARFCEGHFAREIWEGWHDPLRFHFVTDVDFECDVTGCATVASYEECSRAMLDAYSIISGRGV